ncbi:MAG: hypothetical protein HKO56_03480 [Bacteroidia bacterium]|nr:hypothetical protein [Bacteroidia bacterium]NNC85679.1 hypothetical protein [Bacteroidia bacterium]NNM15698.1 hypothetical protein [Bacteroidia bacterium]
MQKIFLLSLVLALFAADLSAQTIIDENEDYKPVLYRNEYSFGFMLHSNGWGINFNRGKHITGYKKRMFEFDFVGMKHPKEVKTLQNENAKSYVYGKLNTFSILRSSIGEQKLLYSRNTRQGVEVRLNYAVGASFGITKPVYLEILVPIDKVQPVDTFPSARIEVQKYDPDEHFTNNIVGRANFFNGIDELDLHPGLHGKLAISFGYGYLDDDVKALETGMTIDLYPKDIPIMALIDNNSVYFNFYFKLLYGRKW